MAPLSGPIARVFRHPDIHPSAHIIGSAALSSDSILMYESIAALNAAKPAQPTAIACGPPPFARNAPVMHPAATPLLSSFFALKPSITHSVPANSAPMYPKFFAELNEALPISLNPILSCSFNGIEGMLPVPTPPGIPEESGVS